MTPEPTGQQDLMTYVRILWRWKLLFLCFLVLIPLGAYFLERGKPKIYQSSTLIEPLNNSISTGSGVPIVALNLTGVAALVTTTDVARAAAALLHPPGDPGSLLGEVSAVPNLNTGFLTITVQDRNPDRAAAIANAFAAALNTYQQRQAIRSIDAQIAAYSKELTALPRSDKAARLSISQQIATLSAQRTSPGAGAQIIEPAVASATPIGSSVRRALEIAFVIAVLLGAGAVLVAEKSDRRIRSPEDLEALANMPLLGTLAASAFSYNGRDSPRDDEAFQMLSAALNLFNLDRRVESVAITSPGPAEGKTTVAVGLALASARAGKRVILIDADLRRPQVSARLGISAAAGLGAVLLRERRVPEVLVNYQAFGPDGGHLLVLPAGPPRPQAISLLASQEMRALLQQLERHADLVIVDTPAALAVSDALPLLPAVSGVVMVVRMNQSSRAAVRRLQKVLFAAGATVVGVVATASTPGSGEYSGASGYYGVQNHGGHRLRSLVRRRRRHAAPRTQAAPSTVAVRAEPNLAAAPLQPPRVPQQPRPNGSAQPLPPSARPSRAEDQA